MIMLLDIFVIKFVFIIFKYIPNIYSFIELLGTMLWTSLASIISSQNKRNNYKYNLFIQALYEMTISIEKQKQKYQHQKLKDDDHKRAVATLIMNAFVDRHDGNHVTTKILPLLWLLRQKYLKNDIIQMQKKQIKHDNNNSGDGSGSGSRTILLTKIKNKLEHDPLALFAYIKVIDIGLLSGQKTLSSVSILQNKDNGKTKHFYDISLRHFYKNFQIAGGVRTSLVSIRSSINNIEQLMNNSDKNKIFEYEKFMILCLVGDI